MSENQENSTIHKNSTSDDDLKWMKAYLLSNDPLPEIIKRSAGLSICAITLYFLFCHGLAEHTEAFYPIIDFWNSVFSNTRINKTNFEENLKTFFLVQPGSRINRMLLITYFSFYVGMWWAYFKSKIKRSKDEEDLKGTLNIQTLRRLLGYTSEQWSPKEYSHEDSPLIESYRRKGESGMQVLAVLVAVSLLIFDQIFTALLFIKEITIWQNLLLWFGMLASTLAFICFLLCVDSLDTMFNSFKSGKGTNSLVHYFYSYTIDPRYVGTASLLLAMALVVSYHSEFLGSLTLALTMIIGYKLWFPNLGEVATKLDIDIIDVRKKSGLWAGIILLCIPFFIQALNFF